MPPQQETEKSFSKNPHPKQYKKQQNKNKGKKTPKQTKKRFCCSVTDKETHEDKKAGDLY